MHISVIPTVETAWPDLTEAYAGYCTSFSTASPLPPVHALIPQTTEGHAGDGGEGPSAFLLCSPCLSLLKGSSADRPGCPQEGGPPGALCFFCKPDFFRMVGFFPVHPLHPKSHTPLLPVVFVFRESA